MDRNTLLLALTKQSVLCETNESTLDGKLELIFL